LPRLCETTFATKSINFFNKKSSRKDWQKSLDKKAKRSHIGEIDTCGQFHQHFMCDIFADILLPKNY